MLLRPRAVPNTLVLVIAVHLESGKPSDSAKVKLRQAQAHAISSELSKLTSELRTAGHRVAVVVGGDWNGLREVLAHSAFCLQGDSNQSNATAANVLQW